MKQHIIKNRKKQDKHKSHLFTVNVGSKQSFLPYRELNLLLHFFVMAKSFGYIKILPRSNSIFPGALNLEKNTVEKNDFMKSREASKIAASITAGSS